MGWTDLVQIQNFFLTFLFNLCCFKIFVNGKNRHIVVGVSISKYNLMEIIDLVHLNDHDTVSGGLKLRVIKG